MAADAETRFRDHVAMLREATKGLGHDFEAELLSLERKIERSAHLVGRDLTNLQREIDYDLFVLGVKIHRWRKNLPQNLAAGVRTVGRGALEVGRLSGQAMGDAGKAVKRGVKRELAKAAGVRHEPLSEWQYPSEKND